ncbi:coat protein [Red clover cryptic virus 1]|uniref:coat protein n=1 Tax=Red clover cryptic virus 1 TaxID=1408894 RepID=UPI0003B9FC25|nr:coat protein [Red clover cryptic virus 1]AGY36139.1 coat protein [Red clover cryptic virus 1]
MNHNTPPADANGPALPEGSVPPPNPPTHIPVAPAAPGAVQTPPAPPARRNRQPHGPVPAASNHHAPGAPALLELSAAYPMYTEQRRGVNFFVPDSQMLFHVLGMCDQMMNSTDRFLRSSPAWLPIVSQLYIAVLWNVMICRVYINTGYASHLAPIIDVLISHLQIHECMIPGPLVPFFQSLAAVNGPFDWIGDITPAMPAFASLWNAEQFTARDSYARQIPIPAIILDQLHHFATRAIVAGVANYGTFEWYRSIFNRGVGATPANSRLGPQLCGSLFTTNAQFDAARAFWNSALASGITRTDAARPPLVNYAQLLGFQAQDGSDQLNWFQFTSSVMQTYCQYFNGSVPLKSISLTGIGAVVTYGIPVNNVATRNWFYPTAAMIEPFATSRYAPRREIPNQLAVKFQHADHEVEEQAEQYAILTHTNIKWYESLITQNALTAVTGNLVHQGDYWRMMPFRYSSPISLKVQYAQIIASRYHQLAANRAE